MARAYAAALWASPAGPCGCSVGLGSCALGHGMEAKPRQIGSAGRKKQREGKILFLFLFLKLNFPNIFSIAFKFSLSFSLNAHIKA